MRVEQRRLRALAAGPRAVYEDLWTVARDPLPLGRHLGRLPHVHTVVLVILLGMLNANESEHSRYGADTEIGFLIVVLQSAAVAVAMVRPVPAWWFSTGLLFAAALVGESSIDPDRLWPWNVAGIALHSLVLLLLALRIRPQSAAVAVAITVLTGVAGTAWATQEHNQGVTRGSMCFIAAVVIGAARRSGRLAKARLAEQEELTAEERARRTLLEERNRIARELHDVVAHHMSVISIQAQVAPHLVTEPPQELKENLAGIRQNAVEALAELRRVLGVLRSEDARADGVRHAPQPTLDRLDELLGNVRSAGLAVTSSVTGAPRPLPPGVELSAFRIVQEALSNAMRHAPGAPVRVETAYGARRITVRVVNSAPDVPAPRSPGAGHGVLGMRERAAMLGGDLAVGPTPDGGYEVTAVLPCTPSGLPGLPGPSNLSDPSDHAEDAR
ncbi:sensor histidine kinase [Streptomyces rectiverticillatus]|uniref:sensor histidine kinase n=1 Tax=Streptomyces rectiverticillatus TaxID=173860 RepID=UPI0015C3C5AF|nr:sensor histidine kinase [Streptomyces rectiverticillatus]QLE70699.1 sensor histidine kinase [Streptomyces rectiverticillatus]